jgi:hypothetical protein
MLFKLASGIRGRPQIEWGRDSLVGIETGYGLAVQGFNPGGGGGGRFSAPVHTGPGGPPSLPYNGYRDFPGGKAAEARSVLR